MFFRFLIFSLVAMAALAAGPVGAREIRAQVFVVTKGGQSIKLALAKVYLVNLDDIAQMQQRAKAVLDESQAHERALTQAAERVIEAQRKRIERAQAHYEERSRRHGEMFATTGDSAEWRAYKRTVEEAERHYTGVRREAEAAIENIRAELVEAIQRERKLAEAVAYSMPAEMTPTCLTDAEGEFAIAPSPADVTHVLVIGQRQEPAEFYQWLVPISEMMAKEGKYLFSNHNRRGVR